MKQLPPAVPGTINNLVNVAIGGPIKERGANAAEYSLREWQVRRGLQQGVYLVRVQTAQGAFTRSISLNWAR